MYSESMLSTVKAFDMLVRGREVDKVRVLEWLVEPNRDIDLPQLSGLIINAVGQHYKYSRVEDERSESAETRRRLMGALARISDGDADASEMVRRHLLDRHLEGNRWVRYEILAGLAIADTANDLEDLAQKVLEGDEEPLMQGLALAVLASRDNKRAKEKILKELQDDEWPWGALRGLRIVPVKETVADLSRIAGDGLEGQDRYHQGVVHDAIVALGTVPAAWPHAEQAARVLDQRIVWCRKYTWMLTWRLRSLRSLGNLRVNNTAPRFVEELADSNASVIYEAARGLREVLGTRTAVARIVEAAAVDDRDYVEGYADALRWMDRNPVTDARSRSLSVVEELEELMVSGPVEQQNTARRMLTEIGGLAALQKLRSRATAVDRYLSQMKESEEQIRRQFDRSIDEARRGFGISILMDVVVFILGIVLIGVSGAIALLSEGTLANWVGVGLTGATGVLGIVYGTLIRGPRKQVREAVDHLMQLKVIFLAYLRQLHQADQAYTRHLVEDTLLDPKEVGNFADMIESKKVRALEQLNLLSKGGDGIKLGS